MTEFVIDVITSADGFASKADGSVEWFGASGDLESTNESQGEFLDSLEAIMIGRRTYELFSQFWPYADPDSVPGARQVNQLPRYVLSSSLTAAPWGDYSLCQVLQGDPRSCAAEIAGNHSGTVVIWGSLGVCRDFLAEHLVSRVRVRTVPVLLGAGHRYAPDSAMQLVHATSAACSDAGNVTIEYSVLPRGS